MAKKENASKKSGGARSRLKVLKPHFHGILLTFQVLGGMMKLPV